MLVPCQMTEQQFVGEQLDSFSGVEVLPIIAVACPWKLQTVPQPLLYNIISILFQIFLDLFFGSHILDHYIFVSEQPLDGVRLIDEMFPLGRAVFVIPSHLNSLITNCQLNIHQHHNLLVSL
jgi:hypothetical protein